MANHKIIKTKDETPTHRKPNRPIFIGNTLIRLRLNVHFSLIKFKYAKEELHLFRIHNANTDLARRAGVREVKTHKLF